MAAAIMPKNCAVEAADPKNEMAAAPTVAARIVTAPLGAGPSSSKSRQKIPALAIHKMKMIIPIVSVGD